MIALAKVGLTARYTGNRCRLDIQVPAGRRKLPLNIRGWNDWDENRVRFQLSQQVPVRVGIRESDFNPLRPVDLVAAARAIAEDYVEAVVFVPKSREHFKTIEAFVRFFDPLFTPADPKEDLTTPEMVNRLVSLNTLNNDCNLRFSWLAVSGDNSGPLIMEKLAAGKSLNEAIDEVISPQAADYFYFYFPGEDREIVDALQFSIGRAWAIPFPEEFLPLRNPQAAVFKNGRINCGMISGSLGPGVTFLLPIDEALP